MIAIGWSIPTGHWNVHAPQVVHDQIMSLKVSSPIISLLGFAINVAKVKHQLFWI